MENLFLTEAYRELADYYQTVIVPRRVRSPKDKAGVEGTVGFISRQIIAALRHYQCFDLRDLNQQIWKKLNELSQETFQKRPGSRKKFDEEEKSYLNPLRQTRFKLSNGEVQRFNLSTTFKSNACIIPFLTSIFKVTLTFVSQRN